MEKGAAFVGFDRGEIRLTQAGQGFGALPPSHPCEAFADQVLRAPEPEKEAQI
jgi:hypothetical protein